MPDAFGCRKMRKVFLILLEHMIYILEFSSLEEYPDQVRTVRSITLTEEDGVITLAFVGKGFLRYMVRHDGFCIIEIGQHKYEPTHIQEI